MEIKNKVKFSLSDFKAGRKVYECKDSIFTDDCIEVVPEIYPKHLQVGQNQFDLKGRYGSYHDRIYDFCVNLFHDGDDGFKVPSEKKKYYYYKSKKAKA